jgi:hypothetical protein
MFLRQTARGAFSHGMRAAEVAFEISSWEYWVQSIASCR